MSTTQAAATEDLRDHGYATMIHGHTHHPATHDHFARRHPRRERWVLADWHEDRGGALTWDETLRREAILLR